MQFRFTNQEDVYTISLMNNALIQEEKHRNTMSPGELEQRMASWLAGRYRPSYSIMKGKQSVTRYFMMERFMSIYRSFM